MFRYCLQLRHMLVADLGDRTHLRMPRTAPSTVRSAETSGLIMIR